MRRGASKRPSHAAFSLTNAVAVLPDRVEETTLVIRDGLIHRIDAVHATAARRVDCARDYLLPGLIEIHTDNIERHLEPRPGTFWNTDRAVISHDAELATAGITTAFDAITLGCDVSDAARESAYLGAIDSLLSAAAEKVLRIEHLLHLRCELVSPRLTDYLTAATRARNADLISLMEHVPGQGQWQDAERFREHYARRYDLNAAELDALIARRKNDQQQFSAINRSHVIELAKRHDTILASHDDAIPDDVERAAQSGCSIAEFPTSLVAARHARTLDMHVLAGAPNLVRGGSHSGNVSASALIAENMVDILSSDYCPSSLLQAVFYLALNAMPLHSAVAMASANPARALRLPDRGSIVEGMRADLIRVRDTKHGPIVISAWCGGRQVA